MVWGTEIMPLDRLPPKRRTKIAAAGNAALRESGKVHKFSSEKAREAVAKRWQNYRLRIQKEEQEALDNHDQ